MIVCTGEHPDFNVFTNLLNGHGLRDKNQNSLNPKDITFAACNLKIRWHLQEQQTARMF